eukprot:7381757-Prymnesium_polylepis.1
MALHKARESLRLLEREAASSPEPSRDSPWSATHEIELRAHAEGQLSHWRNRARAAEQEVRELRSALDEQQGNVGVLKHGSSQFYREVEVWRLKMGRWDHQNWADLCASGLRGPQDG